MSSGDLFDYTGKTAVQALKELCEYRGYPQPLFLDRSNTASSNISVTTVVGSKIYGTGEGESSIAACERAATVTLKAWIGSDFNPELLKQMGSDRPQTRTNSQENESAGDGTQVNALSLLNLYVSAVLNDNSSKPKFEILKDHMGIFHCTLSITIDGKTYKSDGEGKTKVVAKRIASFLILQHIFPGCSTVSELDNAVQKAIESRRAQKKSKSSRSPLQPSPAFSTAPIQSVDSPSLSHSSIKSSSTTTPVVDDLTATVQAVAQNLASCNIILPDGFQLRLATADDAGAIMNLIVELAVYEKSPDSVNLSLDTFTRDGWGVGLPAGTPFRPHFYVYIVESNTTGQIIGMALFFSVYSTWEGRFMYLEDLYVQEAYRANGIGTILMRAVAAVAERTGMKRYQWQCLSWNEKPLEFYKSIGGEPMHEWCTLRMEHEEMKQFVMYGRSKGNKAHGDGAEITSRTADVSVNEGEKSDSKVDTSWADVMNAARKVAEESDMMTRDFHPPKPSCDDDSEADEGGFCQPKSLASFVSSTLSSSITEPAYRNNTGRKRSALDLEETADKKIDMDSRNPESCKKNKI
mmetsp:Transcript_26210/g.38832  ORF Transcript_26210/g.38832 Transcript_26210/m.38832 type:complete len:578 (-) Transcript_26210:106-1839(-)